jgi:hypothetical protein
MKLALPGLAAMLAGCAGAAAMFSSEAPIQVREVARSLYCNSAGDEAQARLLPDAQAVLDWQAARGITLAGGESLAQAPYALVEMGQRPTGGYSLAVASAALLRGELVVLQATFFAPPAGSLRTQALTAPCVLVQLPAGRYQHVEVHDPAGAVRASGGLSAPAMPAAPEPAQ